METLLTVTGMTCANCVRHVDTALRRVDGVQDVRVDLSAGTARVQHDAPAALAQLVAAVEEEGYEARAAQP